MPVVSLGDALLFGVPVVLSSATLAAMHWFPWNKGTGPLDPVTAYTLGTLVVVGVPVLTMLLSIAFDLNKPETFWVWHLLANTAACGATVRVAYWIDGGKAQGLEDSNHDDSTL